jgi:hypothetical protein
MELASSGDLIVQAAKTLESLHIVRSGKNIAVVRAVKSWQKLNSGGFGNGSN